MENIDPKLQELLGKPQKDIYQVLGMVKPTLDTLLGKAKSFVGGLANQQDRQIYSGAKQIAGAIGGTQQDAQTAYNQAKPNMLHGKEIPVRITPKGIVSNIGGKYQGVDPFGAVGSMENVAKQGLERVGSKLLGKVENKLNPADFKTAEDYIKAQGETLYHGTDAKFNEFSLKNSGATDEGFLGKGIYLTADKKYAKEYGKNIIESKANIKNPLEINDTYMFGGVNPDTIRTKLGLSKNASVSSVRNELIKQGYDGVVVNQITDNGLIKNIEVVGLNPSQIKTKPQLISEWNKAQPLKSLAGEAKKLDYRIPHQISDATPVSSLNNIDEIVKQHKINNGYLTKYDLKDLSNLKKLIDNPNKEVIIYRASPVNELNSGDWITTSKTYAQDIKKQNGGKVFEYTVKAQDLLYPNDITELPSLARFSAFKYLPK